MPLYHIQLNADNVLDESGTRNHFKIQNSHRIRSQSMTLKSCSITTSPFIQTTQTLPTLPQPIKTRIPDGDNVLFLDFNLDVVNERQCVGNVAGGGKIPIAFNYSIERDSTQQYYIDDNIHFGDVPFVYDLRIYKSDGVTPFRFKSTVVLPDAQGDKPGETIRQMDLIFEYMDTETSGSAAPFYG